MERSTVKRAAAMAAAVSVAISSMAGCSSSTDYSITANSSKVNAGVYINYILNEMSNQMYTMYYSGEISDPKECLEKDIDGTDFKTYVKDKALESTKEFAAVRAKFEELGLELSEEDTQTIQNSVSSAWSSSKDYYEYEGISKESLTQCYEISYMRSAIFDSFYGEGGTEEVTTDDVQNYLNENYIRYKILNIPKSSEEDEDAAAAENEELKALWEQYLNEAEDLDFTSFDTVIDEYNAYKEEKAAEEAAAEEAEESDDTTLDLGDGVEVGVEDLGTVDEESTEDTVSEEETAVSAEAEELEAEAPAADTEEETVTAEEDTAEDDSTSGESADAEDTDSETADDADDYENAGDDIDEDIDDDAITLDLADAEETEEEPDPYANERIVNYTENTDTSDEYYDEDYAAMLTAIKDAEDGKATSYENDNYYMIFVSAPISERTDYTEDNKETLVQEIKGDEFDELVKSWVDAMSIVVNDKAIKRYTVQEVYDRQEKYYAEQ